MRVHHAARVLGVDGEEHRHRARRRDDEVVANHRGALARHEHARDVVGLAGVALPAQPPPGTAAPQSVELVGGVIA